MIASRRRWHYQAWLALVPLLLTGLIIALSLREPRPVQEPARVTGAAP
jgi:hypothetical protein